MVSFFLGGDAEYHGCCVQVSLAFGLLAVTEESLVVGM